MHCWDLELLLRKYANAETKEDRYIKKTLENIAAQFIVCDADQRYYADVITRDFCRIIKMLEERNDAVLAEKPVSNPTSERKLRYQSSEDLLRDFYNHYKRENQVDYRQINSALEQGRKDLVNPTLKDYVARIYTFSGPKYLGEMVSVQELGRKDPVLFTYENIEVILATFKTRDAEGKIVKQRVNIRSALRKLNEFKQHTEQ